MLGGTLIAPPLVKEAPGCCSRCGMTTRTTAFLRVLAALGLCLLVTPAAGAQELPGVLHAFLQRQMQLSPADFAALGQGEVVATLPGATDAREVAAFGIVRVNAPGAALVRALLDIENYARNDAVLQVGRFSDPPTLADVKALTLEEDDLEALRHCRTGSCGLKLSAAMIERFRTEVRWTAPNWREDATALFRQVLVDYVIAYGRDGQGALAEYVDKPALVKLADETRALVRESPYLRDTAPELLGHLGDLLPAPLPHLKHVVYWAKEDFGFKPTITITQVTIYEPGTGPAPTIFAVSRQLYATHYFEASVALTVASAITSPQTPPAFHLLQLNRSRIDSLRGGFHALKRFTAGRRIRKWLEATLGQSRTHIERQAARARE